MRKIFKYLNAFLQILKVNIIVEKKKKIEVNSCNFSVQKNEFVFYVSPF